MILQICYYLYTYEVFYKLFLRCEGFIMKKILSILLIAMLLIGEAVFVVSATDGVAPVTVQNVKAYSAYKGVALEWAPVEGATSYEVYKNGKRVKKGLTLLKNHAYDNKKMMSCYVRTKKEGGKADKYQVVAVNSFGESAKSKAVKKNSVTPMLIGVTFRGTCTLRAHDGSGARHTFRSGQRVKAHSFKFGQYIFRYGGHIYHANYSRLWNFTSYTNKYYGSSREYSDKEAEYFVNTANVDSDTKYLIWASLYTQRLYVFKGKSGNAGRGHWRLAKTTKWNGENGTARKGYKWQISSGRATSPSPASLWFATQRRRRSKDGVNYLTYYHSQTSLHGTVGNQGLDDLRSGGCIRMADKYSGLIYYNMPLLTRLSIY